LISEGYNELSAHSLPKLFGIELIQLDRQAIADVASTVGQTKQDRYSIGMVSSA